jgi:hypothetical protein
VEKYQRRNLKEGATRAEIIYGVIDLLEEAGALAEIIRISRIKSDAQESA